MARIRMVTRTVTETVAEVLVVDVVKGEMHKQTFKLSGKLSQIEALKQMKKQHDTDEFKIAAVKSIDYRDVHYGMTEQKFIENADILPERETKN